ncbi:alpha/beta hydrolase [Paraburkholderia sp. J41]|uniref:alpha/beta fold hydrolase n=1 Tax=Paraburkholderia sp. J41 TaxID=2805433 RepID=UPI002AC31806|nr:alpha/beta hydrolase [Paraburkholderia sp. J41]
MRTSPNRPFARFAAALAAAACCHAAIAADTDINAAAASAPVAATASGPADSGPADSGPAYGPRLEGFAYPYPVRDFAFDSQGQTLHMAYMDVAPTARPNGRTAVLLHGKNFCAATWQDTIGELTNAGYRVIAPDQIGFCKSSKPAAYQFTFQQLARNTHALLASLGVNRATIIGHSTGGMLGVRYALMYPRETEQLVLVNPIGFEDWKAKGVPSISVDQWYARELKTTADSIRRYEQSTYYAGQWRASYEPWVQMLAGMYRGPGKAQVAWDSALLYDMIYTQPVVYEFGQLQMPTLLLIGDKDTTAIGKDLAPPEVRAQLGHYPVLAKEAQRAIAHATLVEFPDAGHAPQMQDPAAFHAALLKGLAALGTP